MNKKTSPLLKKLKFLKPRTKYSEGWSEMSPFDREWEKVYRRRWQHDKIVRSTHGVNCTGSCSWKVYVKDGIVTWETQQTDYPTTGPDMPEYEPRGCPRGASFSWYIYSPLRVRYPYVRGVLLRLWREALEKTNDPVAAWKSILEDPEKTAQYKSARGKGGFVRASWDEINQLISASLIYTIQQVGPDRIFGFSPIPAMSMVSYAGGSRFLTLLGGALISFYDWYADLPPASPQIWGDQTDVPESGDWYNSSYMMIWGSNLPQTRTPDSHFMVEARYRGTKVVAVSPDYAEYVKFADHWLAVHPGKDAALAMAMTHVILKEFYVDKETEYFNHYAKTYTDLPFLVTLKKRGDHFTAERFLRASDLGFPLNKAEWKAVVLDQHSNQFTVPNGSIGHRWEEKGNWNLHLIDEVGNLPIDPALTLLGNHDEVISLALPYFDDTKKEVLYRSVPAKKIDRNGEPLYVATVFDLMLANVGIGRGLAGDYPVNYDDPKPYTPAWQEAITGVDRNLAAQIAREFAQNAIDTKGRSMIVMGAGINHWYHSDLIYRSILNLVLLTGSQGVNGGGWAHYVGQEKLRPLEGWQTIAFARDWGGPPRLQNGTSFMYFASSQWRYEEIPVRELISPLKDKPRYEHYADYNALAARLGWLPFYPQFDQNSIKLIDKVKQTGAGTTEEIITNITNRLKQGKLQFAVEDPDNPNNFPKVLFVWRANLIGSSAKGHEYFLKHLLGTHHGDLSEENQQIKTREVKWNEKGSEGKLDLLVNIDFRMSGTSVYSDIVLPAATWYEKYDLSSTDMHPFIHPFNPAITPPWEAKSDWDTFKKLAKTFSELAVNYFPETQQDLVATPLLHDSPDEIAQPLGQVPDWKTGDIQPIPGVNLPRLHIVDRDYKKVYEKMIALGPLVKESIGSKGITWNGKEEYERLQRILGTVSYEGEYKECPSLFSDRDVAEAILTLSSTTNGAMAVKAWEALEKKTSLRLRDLAEERKEEQLSFSEITAQPKKVMTSPVFSGTETGNRRYSPFTTNVEKMIPWRTLTGRQHFYLDHEVIQEFGEELPLYKPTLPIKTFYPADRRPDVNSKEITLRYLTPHFKWSYHSTYGDTLPMLTLFRGGPHVWMNNKDAEEVGIADNDWLEMYNRNGVVVARAVVSHRIPRGTAFMYHVQDRIINVPGSPITKERGGTFNSPTKIYVKPTHMIGGYAQLSYGFNYYGPTGNQRDMKVVIRRLKEVSWLEN
ncbi:nitrate reductase subunit alpha [Microaerobacter geothermalis]|uniref:nitrate reductase subunit alpha n=1 Tax=Microaerobacter geothermalis TaxID=674972 RepID=UPI001F186B40|nr:nitrate reductase subunit alpha [Microaerobacter geothermalis]MCF6094466.1 nitrate reductase subunit alpha [Microaerobacter geothermalis]